jgi:curved DNA-binding protein CbpA
VCDWKLKPMANPQTEDLYEALQISPNADADTIQRVFRLLAQKYHPDNQETGDSDRFRRLHEAYLVLSDPEKRARYDATYEGLRRERWRFAAGGPPAENDFETEQQMRCVALEILYHRRRTDPGKPSLSNLDLAELMGRPREHLQSHHHGRRRRLRGREPARQDQATALGRQLAQLPIPGARDVGDERPADPRGRDA